MAIGQWAPPAADEHTIPWLLAKTPHAGDCWGASGPPPFPVALPPPTSLAPALALALALVLLLGMSLPPRVRPIAELHGHIPDLPRHVLQLAGGDALGGKPRRRPRRRLGRRLEEVAEAVGGGYCRLQMPLRPALSVRETVAGRRLGALEGPCLPGIPLGHLLFRLPCLFRFPFPMSGKFY